MKFLQFPSVYDYNPFNNIFNVKNYSSSVTWFPEKTENLHGFKMKVGANAQAPVVYLTLDENRQVTSASGPDVALVKTLSAAMNFQISWFILNRKTVGSPSCIKEKNTGYLYSILHEEINLIATQIGRSETCGFLQYTTFTRHVILAIAVPNLSNTKTNIIIKYEFFKFLVILSFIFILLFMVKILQFPEKNWKWEYLLQVALGLYIHREPKKLAERIMFGAILIGSLFQSSIILTVITNAGINVEAQIELNTIGEFLKSNLEAIISKDFFLFLYNVTDGSSRLLLEKSTKMNINDQQCLKLLLTENKSCLVRYDVAEWMMSIERNQCGKPALKVIPEYMVIAPGSIVMEVASPFIRQFDKIILRLWSNGLLTKWQKPKTMKQPDICISQQNDPNISSIQLLHLLISGYLISCCLFFGEIIFSFLSKKENRSAALRRF